MPHGSSLALLCGANCIKSHHFHYNHCPHVLPLLLLPPLPMLMQLGECPPRTSAPAHLVDRRYDAIDDLTLVRPAYCCQVLHLEGSKAGTVLPDYTLCSQASSRGGSVCTAMCASVRTFQGGVLMTQACTSGIHARRTSVHGRHASVPVTSSAT